jgi:hypothetical protein
MAAGDVPPYHEPLLPALQVVGELGGSASIGEIVETVITREGFSDARQAVLHNDGPETEIGYRLAWVRTYLKGMGLQPASRGSGSQCVTDGSASPVGPRLGLWQLRRSVIDLQALRFGHGARRCYAERSDPR